jgi:hypothetical protein
MSDTVETLRHTQNMKRAENWLFSAQYNLSVSVNPFDDKKLLSHAQCERLTVILHDISDQHPDDPIATQQAFTEAAQPVLADDKRLTVIQEIRQDISTYRLTHPHILADSRGRSRNYFKPERKPALKHGAMELPLRSIWKKFVEQLNTTSDIIVLAWPAKNGGLRNGQQIYIDVYNLTQHATLPPLFVYIRDNADRFFNNLESYTSKTIPPERREELLSAIHEHGSCLEAKKKKTR